MAVQAVCQLRDDWSGRWTIPYSATFTVRWQCTAEKDDGPFVVADQAQSAFGVHALGEAYGQKSFGGNTWIFGEGDRGSVCTGISVERLDGSDIEWIYTATFGSRQGPQTNPPPGDVLPGDEDEDPLKRPEREWWEWEPREKLMRDDVDENTISNSAGVPFLDPPVTIDDPSLIYVVQKNFPGQTTADKNNLVSMAKALKNRTNLTTWRGYDPDTVQMRPLIINGPRYENKAIYYEVQFRARVFDPDSDPSDTPILKPLDLGNAELITVRGGQPEEKTIPKEITDGLAAYTGEIKLNGYGRPLSDQTANAVVLDGSDLGQGVIPGPYRLYKQAEFNAYLP